MGRIFTPEESGWRHVERRGADQVTSYLLLPTERGGRTRLSLTRIERGGAFGPHIDDYEHVFCVLQGRGEAMVGKERRAIEPGDLIVTDIREPHGLWADSAGDLVLLTANVYPETTG
ncbi:MAG: cupin domain-containing protein [Acidothermus cellulolyticus]|nr:cupin domain-containing protein [Acidothermus cellulolyticus]MCL6551293.1 cupin domain-containing protein [Acidothermus cellulolyticus]